MDFAIFGSLLIRSALSGFLLAYSFGAIWLSPFFSGQVTRAVDLPVTQPKSQLPKTIRQSIDALQATTPYRILSVVEHVGSDTLSHDNR